MHTTASTNGVPPLTDADYRDQAEFRIALRHFLHFAEEQAIAAGVTPQQYLLLLITRGHANYPRVAIRELADALQLRQSSMSLLVDRTVKRGLLDRSEDPEDRRRVMISLTPAGQEVLERIVQANRRELGLLEDRIFRSSLKSAVDQYRSLDGH